ncbi:MAG: phosphosugar isomerase [Actinomycetales bacterium]|nr:phosphosugar isomerase [Actinomycetales bacterium]
MARWDETILDDAAAVERLDTRATLLALATAGAQVREGLRLADDAGAHRVVHGDRPRGVVVGSLGGSSVVADVLELLTQPGSPVPLVTRHDVPLPGWVGALDLVIGVSHSGRAPGPVALVAEAVRRGASVFTVGAADSPLADISARGRGVHVDVPVGRVSTRTSLWALLTPVLVAAEHLGLTRLGHSVLPEVADRLDRAAAAYGPAVAFFDNPAKLLAADLAHGIPVVLGAGPLSGVAARRGASMLSRTARVPATWGELPDAASQVVALLDGPYAGVHDLPDIFRDPFLDGPTDPRLTMLLLRGADPEHEPLADGVAESARAAGLRVSDHRADTGHDLGQLAQLVALVDFAATYLALGLGLDPGVSEHVTRLRDHTS